MAGLKLSTALLLVISSLAIGGIWVEAQVHHVVGGESGWHPSSDLGSWSAGRNFRVGDHLCKHSPLYTYIYIRIHICMYMPICLNVCNSV